MSKLATPYTRHTSYRSIFSDTKFILFCSLLLSFSATNIVFAADPPDANCKNHSVNLNGSGIASINVNNINNGSTDYDNLSLSKYTFNCTNIGPNTVTLTASASGETPSNCTATVTVNDLQIPTIQNCPTNSIGGIDTIKANVENGTCLATVTLNSFEDYDDVLSASDNCSIIFTNSFNNQTGIEITANFPFGQTTVTFSAKDPANNEATCSIIVEVKDNESPTLNCPDDATVNINSSTCNNNYSVPLPTKSDNCSISTLTNNLNTSNYASATSGFSEILSLGTHQITWIAKDIGDNTALCSYFVYVVDNIPPSITCPANITTTGSNPDCSASIMASQIDLNSSSHPTNDACGPITYTNNFNGTNSAAGDYPVGTTTLTWSASDASFNTNNCTVTITVTDSQFPVITTCPTNISQTNDLGFCGANLVIGLPTVSDNCGIESVINSFNNTNSASDFYPIGTTTINFIAKDFGGNTDNCDMTITITDNEAPLISCPANITQSATTGSCDAIVTVPAPLASDNCNTSLTYTNNKNGAADASDTYDVGINTVTFTTATDGAGLNATCSFTVTVTDNEAPSLTCPDDFTVVTAVGNCDASVTLPALNALNDNCTFTPTVTTLYVNNSTAIPVNVSGVPSDTYTLPLGNTVVTYYAQDAPPANTPNVGSCNLTILVENNAPPSVVCPASITTVNDSDQCGATLTINTPTVSNTCNPPIVTNTFNNNDNASDFYPVGTTAVTFTATDEAGLQGSCNFTVTVGDTQQPTITCPAALTVNNDPGSCTAYISVLVPSVYNDNCGIAIGGLSNDFNNSFNAYGQYPIGSTTVTWSMVDLYGLGNSCSTTVTVNNAGDLYLTCELPIIQDADPNSCTAVLSIPNPTISDNCTIAIVNTLNSFNNLTDASDAYPIGTTVLTFTTTDAIGNIATCTQNITINDNQAPNIICPAAISQNIDATSCTAYVSVPLPTSTDNCTVASTMNLFNGLNDASDEYSIGTTTVTFIATDNSGNNSNCDIDITVIDNINPVIVCPQNINVNNSYDFCGAGVAYYGLAANDNCGAAAITLSSGLGSGSVFLIGTSTETYTATDESGNTATCSFTVTVTDTDIPIVTCPTAVNEVANVGSCSATVNLNNATATDNCTVVSVTNSFNNSTNANDDYPIGITNITFTATDDSGNTGTCSVNVTVTDIEAPSITCPTTINANTDANSCSTMVTYTPPIGTDNCTIPTTVLSNGLGNGNIFNVGINTETYTTTDADGNTATCSFDIVITDNQAPTITCGTAITQNTSANNCTAYVDVTPATASDNCTAMPTITNSNGASANASGMYNLGTTAIVFTATDDEGNSGSCTVNVTVIDAENPSITCPNNITLNNDLGLCSATANIDLPIASDNCTVASTSNNFNNTSNASGMYGLGLTPITFTATDGAGNTASCDFIVTVVDNESPSIICPSNISAVDNAGDCFTSVIIPVPTVNDNCTVDTWINNYNSTIDASAVYAVGTTSVTFTAYDNAGNTSNCMFMVTVTENEAPTISCPTDVTANATVGSCTVTLSLNEAVATDNCGLNSVLNDYNNSSNASDDYLVGNTVVVFTATDSSGNTSSCTTTITITDSTPPSIVCPNAIVQAVGTNDNCSTNIIVPFPNTSDDCGIATTINDFNNTIDASGMYPVGSTEVSFTTTDNGGNSSDCSFSITVTENEAPTINCPATINQFVDAGSCGALVNYTPPVGSDNCGIAITNFTAGLGSNVVYPLGTSTETYTVTDFSGNSTACSFDIIISDNELPTALCNNLTINLDDNGLASINVTDIDNGSSDNCSIAATNLSVQDFTCTDVGTQSSVLTVTDGSGNIQTCTAIIEISDTESPTIVCPNDIDTCTPTITTPTVSYDDNCAVTLSIDPPLNSTFAMGSHSITAVATDASGNSTECIFNITYTPLTIELSVPSFNNYDIACAGDNSGEIMLDLITGFGPINYEWSNGATTAALQNISSGTYTLTATDALGCTHIETVVITEPTPLTCTATSTSATCYGYDNGTLSAAAVGGIAPYTFDWQSNNADFLNTATIDNAYADTYNLIVSDANGCTCTSSAVVSQPSALEALSGEINVSEGLDGSSTPLYYNSNHITFTGGQFPYDYTWETTGYVRYEIEDGSITIVYADNATWALTISDATGCDEGEISFTNDSITPGEEGSILDIYDYTITPDNGSGNGSIALSVEGGMQAYTYVWSGPDGWAAPPSNTGLNLLSGLPTGWYTVTITDSSAPQQITIGWYWIPQQNRGRGKIASSPPYLEVAPNPVKTQATITVIPNISGNYLVNLYNLTGQHLQELFNGKLEAQQVQQVRFNINQLPNGIYLCSLSDAKGNSSYQKIIIAH